MTSLNHPRTVQAPRTLNATKANCKKGEKRLKEKKKLTNLQVADLIIKFKMRTMLEVLAYANSRKLVWDSVLYEFVLNRGQKKLSELLKSVWDMQFAREKLERSSQTRLETLQEYLKEKCFLVLLKS